MAEQPLADHTFVSSTFNKMKAVLLDNHRSTFNKLLAIQFLARDHRSSTLHNAKRCISHFFSEKKSEEGRWVSLFCEKLGKASFSDQQGLKQVNDFFTLRTESDLANVQMNFSF
jgi:hypothetical protein